MAREQEELRTASRNPYWREATARAVVGAWRGSGESMRRFCRRHDLRPGRLSRWLRRLEQPESEKRRAEISFLPVRIRGRAEAGEGTAGATIVVRWGGDVRLEVREGFDAPTLRRVLETLREIAPW